jgi:hypothetical protein
MTDLSVKISVMHIYPVQLFNMFEGLELIMKVGAASEEKQHVSKP